MDTLFNVLCSFTLPFVIFGYKKNTHVKNNKLVRSLSHDKCYTKTIFLHFWSNKF